MKFDISCNIGLPLMADGLYMCRNVPQDPPCANRVSAVLAILCVIMRESHGLAVPIVSRESVIFHIEITDMSSLGSDCGPTIKSFPVCADPSLTLYKARYGDYFCCPSNLQGIQGIYPAGGLAGLCVASDMSVALSQSAVKV
jgi:hypothetical protein